MHDEERPEDIRVLVPESERARIARAVTRRQALMAGAGGAMAMYLAACGGSSGGDSGSADGEAASTPAAADQPIEKGPLLMANWVDYSAPANYKAYTKEFGPKITISGYGSNEELLAKLRAGGAKFDVVAPTGYAVQIMIEQGLAQKLNHELLPNLKNLQASFTKLEYDPGNGYSVAKDFGITSFWWRRDKTDFDGKDLKACFDFLKTPEAKDLRVNFLEGSTQNVAIALSALGYSLNSEDEAELDEAKELLISVKPAVDTINSTFIDRATKGDIDFAMAWNGDIRRAIEPLAERGIESYFLVPEGSTEFWLDNWVIPNDAENPIAAHAWINKMLDPVWAGREMNYHAYPVPVKGIKGVDQELVEDPIITIPDETIARYETILPTPKTQSLRDRIYTEFKAA
jgi:spermidine/putrescine transport system substrate-binding protein